MAQVLIRGLDAKLVAKIKRRAKKKGRSLEAEIRMIIQEEANRPELDSEDALQRIEKIRKRLKGIKFPDSAELIREDRDR